ncbi:hypothetical protein AArc1_1129 [Natrarchaeobaculum sulfurireducens]|uniref:Uncharacterized protein n=1 Tax=Natrarchaeobaculum sulfurireducens TaxID=2044521 RepID=A0A346PD75_9EURY|nr:hypothetical protein AArc1_1129 [Natrarchaeobaculum sulfurireducens]
MYTIGHPSTDGRRHAHGATAFGPRVRLRREVLRQADSPVIEPVVGPRQEQHVAEPSHILPIAAVLSTEV